ncbi:bacterial regulatory s, luxR family protein [Yersinia ruckeri]|uniref:response regulator transcription factor n=1 Tax=Yersinia ruckeri TaxID=29486 RepID=UPI0005ABBB1D|nr:response regulator transcription factor [Yersinia ruckeri]AJI95656.1 bacterial regulatory s, luxR family protein [Yersinia ruckeri]MCW6568857.1 response regulator transcription factor [Yersinia ruckeri]
MPRLLLVDDHPVVHVALEAALLQSTVLYRLQGVSDDQQALQQLAEHSFELLILDIGLPQVDGLHFLRKIRRHYSELPVIVYTSQETEVYAKMAYHAGAQGFVHKGSLMTQLLDAIGSVLDGNMAFPEEIAYTVSADNTEKHSLTQKEIQILGLLAKGHSNLHIAQMLNISNKTVSTHKKNILNKTGATNLLELIAVFNDLQP